MKYITFCVLVLMGVLVLPTSATSQQTWTENNVEDVTAPIIREVPAVDRVYSCPDGYRLADYVPASATSYGTQYPVGIPYMGSGKTTYQEVANEQYLLKNSHAPNCVKLKKYPYCFDTYPSNMGSAADFMYDSVKKQYCFAVPVEQKTEPYQNVNIVSNLSTISLYTLFATPAITMRAGEYDFVVSSPDSHPDEIFQVRANDGKVQLWVDRMGEAHLAPGAKIDLHQFSKDFWKAMSLVSH